MNFEHVQRQLLKPIKIVSAILITGAIALELWNIYSFFNHYEIPHRLVAIIWLERFALITHFIEATIAASKASSHNKNPLQYGIYTFFVGTVGLVELFNPEE